MSLLGAWVIDHTDARALAELGDVLLEFDGIGGLQYTIRGRDKDQIIKLRYSIEGSTLITDQPSVPRVERTQFTFLDENVLVLTFNGTPYRFVRGCERATGVLSPSP
jgi:hypothetical protein